MSVAVPVQKAPSNAMQIPSKMKHPTTGQWIPLSSTPGGSIFGTTPGGSRIQYDRNALLNFRNSPLSKSPAHIPQAIINLGVTTEHAQPIPEEKKKRSTDDDDDQLGSSSTAAHSNAKPEQDDEMFEME